MGHARAGRGRRRHRLAGDAAQRGGHQPQGHPRGRPRDRPARRRRDPADRRPGGPAPARDEAVPHAEELPALRRRDREARGRGDAPLPEPRVPVARARDADQLGAGRRGHRGRRRAADPPPLGARPRALAARPLPADEGAAARARRLRGDLARRTRSTRSSIRSGCRSRASCFGLNIPDVGWVTAQSLARHFGTSTGSPRRRRRRSRRSTGSGPSAPRRSSSGSRTTQNRALVAELRELGLRFEAGEEERPVEGPLTGRTYVITGTLEALHPRRGEQRRSRRSAPRSRTRSRRRRPASSSARARRSKLAKAEQLGVPVLDEAALEASYCGRLAAVAKRSCARARPVRRDRAAVLERPRTRSGRDVAGERRGAARRAGLGDDVPARGRPSASGRRACRSARHRQAAMNGRPHRPGRSRPRAGCRRARAPSGDRASESPDPSTIRTPASGIAASPRARAARPPRRRRVVPGAGDRAELLQQQLGREVVALAVHPADDRGERRRLERCERQLVAALDAGARAAGHVDAGAPQRRPEQERGRERRVPRGAAARTVRGRPSAPRAAATR